MRSSDNLSVPITDVLGINQVNEGAEDGALAQTGGTENPSFGVRNRPDTGRLGPRDTAVA